MSDTNLIQELKERGLIDNEGGGDIQEILSAKRNLYHGIDPTADSLHVGNLVPIILAKHLTLAGHKSIFLIGGGTGLIGDPRESGERSLLPEKTIEKNIKALTKQLSALFGKKDLKVVDNAEWLTKLGAIEFLRDVGKYFTVNQLVKRDIIKRRLETEEDSISFTEFSYSLLQAYDYLYLHTKYGTDLQVGGSDQWANIISGVDLIRRKEEKKAYALTTPIITDSSGAKFGKSEGNAVWLDAEKTSPFAFYQFWFNVPDENVESYMKIFTFIPLADIADIVEKHRHAPHERRAQKKLARAVTRFVHGDEAAEGAERVSDILFGESDLSDLSRSDRDLILTNAPCAHVTKEMLVVDALVEAGLAESKGSARRLIEGGSVSVDGVKIDSTDAHLPERVFERGLGLLKKGRSVAVLSAS